MHGSRFEPPPSTCVALQAVLDQEFVPNTPGAVLDSAGMLNILQGALGSGTRVKLTGITGDSTEAEIADAVFPVITTDGKSYLIRIQGQNIITKKATNQLWFAEPQSPLCRLDMPCRFLHRRRNHIFTFEQPSRNLLTCTGKPHVPA